MPVVKQEQAIDTASIQNRISEPLRRAIEPLLEQPATVFDEQIKSLEALLAKADELPKGTMQSTRDSLRALQDARDKANSDYLESVRVNVATAVVAAVRQVDPKIRLEVRQTPAAGGAPSPAASGAPAAGAERKGRKARMSRAEAEKLAGKVLSVLPSAKSGNWITRSEIVEKSDVDNESLQSILLKLKREGDAESNGQRGAAGGWRKTE